MKFLYNIKYKIKFIHYNIYSKLIDCKINDKFIVDNNVEKC